MRTILLCLLLGACCDELTLERTCSKCKAEGDRERHVQAYKKECGETWKPLPPVTDTSDANPINWKCGCIPAEKK